MFWSKLFPFSISELNMIEATDSMTRQMRYLAIKAIAAFLVASSMVGCVTQGPLVAKSTKNISDPALRAEVDKALISQGWQPLGSASSGDLFYVFPGSYRKNQDVTSINVHSMFPSRFGRVGAGNIATRATWEINCSNRTFRVDSAFGHNEWTGADQGQVLIPLSKTFEPIPSGSVPSALIRRVCGSSSSGTGIIISTDRIVTAEHVIRSCGSLDVVYNGKKLGAKTIASDQKNDLALLAVSNLTQTANIYLRRSALNGETVLASGYPLSGLLSSDIIVTTGIVNSQAGILNDRSKIQISAQVSAGNSGGGLLDKSGNLVGIVVSKLDALSVAMLTGDVPQNVNFAVKPEVVGQFLETYKIAMPRADATNRIETEELAKRGREMSVKIECKNRPPAILFETR
jgi:S1-C subfamily serine protease